MPDTLQKLQEVLDALRNSRGDLSMALAEARAMIDGDTISEERATEMLRVIARAAGFITVTGHDAT